MTVNSLTETAQTVFRCHSRSTHDSLVSFQRRAVLRVDSSSDGHRVDDDGQLEER